MSHQIERVDVTNENFVKKYVMSVEVFSIFKKKSFLILQCTNTY
jgi:hypothetical protein